METKKEYAARKRREKALKEAPMRKVPEPHVVTDNPIPPVVNEEGYKGVDLPPCPEDWAKLLQPTRIEPYRPTPEFVEAVTDGILENKYGDARNNIPRLLYYILRELVYERIMQREKER